MAHPPNASHSASSGTYQSPYVNQQNDPAKAALRERYLVGYRKHHDQGIRSLAMVGAANGVDHQSFQHEVEGKSKDKFKQGHHSSGSFSSSSSSSSEEEPSSQPQDKELKLPDFFPPTLTQRDRAILQPLSLPVVIPQRVAGDVQSRFVRAYAPDLARVGIDESTWLSFLDRFGESLTGNALLGVVGAAGSLTHFAPIGVYGLIGPAVAGVAKAASKTQSKAKADAFLSHANDVLFNPRGLIAVVVSTEFKDNIIAAGGRGASSYNPSSPSYAPANLNGQAGFAHLRGRDLEDANREYHHEQLQEQRQLVDSNREHGDKGLCVAELNDHEARHEGSSVKSMLGRAVDHMAKRQNDKAIQKEEKQAARGDKRLARAEARAERRIGRAEARGRYAKADRTTEKAHQRMDRKVAKQKKKPKALVGHFEPHS